MSSTFCCFEDCDQDPVYCALHAKQEAEMAGDEAATVSLAKVDDLLAAMKSAIAKCHGYDPRPNAVIDILQSAMDSYEETARENDKA